MNEFLTACSSCTPRYFFKKTWKMFVVRFFKLLMVPSGNFSKRYMSLKILNDSKSATFSIEKGDLSISKHSSKSHWAWIFWLIWIQKVPKRSVKVCAFCTWAKGCQKVVHYLHIFYTGWLILNSMVGIVGVRRKVCATNVLRTELSSLVIVHSVVLWLYIVFSRGHRSKLIVHLIFLQCS